MLSQPPIIYFLLSGVLAALISGIILTANNLYMTWVNNKFQLEREKQQRSWQEESDQRKWYREKIYDRYTKAIQILTNIIQEKFESNPKDPGLLSDNIIKLSVEFHSEYIMILSGHPAKHSKEFREKVVEIDKSLKKEPWIARNIITELMEQDSRIKNVDKKVDK